MKLKIILTVFIFGSLAAGSSLFVEDSHHDHDSKKEETHNDHKADKKDNHDTDKHDHEKHDYNTEDKSEGGHDDEEESTGGVGPNNAVTAADEHDGIKLSEKAIQTIGLKTEIWNGDSASGQTIVYHQDKTSVYRLKDGWYKLVPVTIISKADNLVHITATELVSGDLIATSGVALLRVAELDAFSGEVEHSH